MVGIKIPKVYDMCMTSLNMELTNQLNDLLTVER